MVVVCSRPARVLRVRLAGEGDCLLGLVLLFIVVEVHMPERRRELHRERE